MYANPSLSAWWDPLVDPVVDWVGDKIGGNGAPGGGAATWQNYYLQEWTGQPCPGAPPAAAVVRGVGLRPDLAERIRVQLAASNNGYAPSLQEMADPNQAFLWINATIGGRDCRNRSAPWMPDVLTELAAAGGNQGQPPITPPGPGQGAPPAQPGILETLFEVAKREGRAAAEQIFRQVVGDVWGGIPSEYREAIEQGVAAGYRDRAVGGVQAALPWIVGLGLVFALGRRRR